MGYSFALKQPFGEVAEMGSIIAGILVKIPNYAEIASAVLAHWHINADLVHKVYEGLALAGIEIECLKPSC